MKLTIYKGFNKQFLKNIHESPLIDSTISDRLNVLNFNDSYRKKLKMALVSLRKNDSVWITYEEYSLIKKIVDDAIDEEGLEVTILKNNLYPDYYPIEFEIKPELENEIIGILNGNDGSNQSEKCRKYFKSFNSLINIDEMFYGSFYNYEYDAVDKTISVKNFYPQDIKVEDSLEQSDFDIFLNEDINIYLKNLSKILQIKPKIISIKSTNGDVSKRMQKSLQAFCIHYGIRLIKSHEKIQEDQDLDIDLIKIAKETIKIEDFQNFRSIKFYKNPDINNEVIELSQSKIIHDIIHQAEKAYKYKEGGSSYRDIFITASTGAGKSVMFQIPAVYLAQKYGKLTIIIEPVKALMQDQKEKLNKSGYTRVEVFNSDLITQVEKESVLQRIKNGEVDILYLSPETLLSYSIESIIGDREIGLIVVDEAHIVTTWGVGFRPDYWYLGNYLTQLRNKVQTSQGIKRKVYHFPICAFTATAVNGGIDDSVSDTVISLYLENPIKYLGYVRRDNIHFDISHTDTGKKLSKQEYEEKKCKALNSRINHWLDNNEKTIVYFPYASFAYDASKGIRGFAGITTDKRIGTYTGRNIEELSNEAFNERKRQTFDAFRNGITPVMLATKAFGMGVDVSDVKNVYHYAASGNLCDYVQEIGRAARKSSIEGNAIMDAFYNDMNFMKNLFGMSQIKQYQIKKVLEGIYETYKSKKEVRNFLISPESFTYIFRGKNEDDCINKLKTCLLMLEKDFYDKYNFKVLISRPQSVFTKAFICIEKEKEREVLESPYGKYIRFVSAGRINELQRDGSTYLSDMGDIYTLDLKGVWEEFYPDMSFPQFKYWYFNSNSNSKNRTNIMPTIRSNIFPRQKIIIEAKHDLLLSELREQILQDFEYIADKLYSKFKKQYFTIEDFAKSICEKYGITKARIIANSLFDLVDPNGWCVKYRSEPPFENVYSLSNGNFKEFMRRPIIKSNVMHNITKSLDTNSYEGYVSLMSDNTSTTALKLLSVFDYITYEVVGGEEPEIFIRLNDPHKIKSIVLGHTKYSNNYVTKAKQKHDRDVSILLRFFNDLKTDGERWDYIENYFLGNDVLDGIEPVAQSFVKMSKSVDKEHSYPANQYQNWLELEPLFDESDSVIIKKLCEINIPLPEYLETTIKHSDEGECILLSWPAKNVLICKQDTSDNTLKYFSRKGWYAYRIHEIDYNDLKNMFY